MAGSVVQPLEGLEEGITDVLDHETGGYGSAGVIKILQGSAAGCATLCIVYVANNTPRRKYTEGFPVQCGLSADRQATLDSTIWKL